MIKKAFPPIVDENATVLILGTMPGEMSLELHQYYGHKANQFCPLVFGVFNLPVPVKYEDRVHFLHQAGIAVWDVLSECKRHGSSDSAIKEEVANDFTAFYKKYPGIRSVFWDSLTAQKLYIKHVGRTQGIHYHLLPSPSPRYAKMSFADKLQRWKKIAAMV